MFMFYVQEKEEIKCVKTESQNFVDPRFSKTLDSVKSTRVYTEYIPRITLIGHQLLKP